jgi:NAD(P)-dependent dehydrogenase (short-subunit alcohol dehydrogenase family)
MVDLRELIHLHDRVAIVTGGARGIGRETAETLSTAGARVVIADRDKGAAEAAATQMSAAGLRALAIHVDVADEASVEAMVRETPGDYGKGGPTRHPHQ